MSIFQKQHPRLARTLSLREFMAARRIFVTAAGTGHPHQVAERSLEEQLPADNIIARVPSFTAAAILAKHTSAIATLPGPVAEVLARELGMQLAKPPIKLPAFEIAQYWHERFDRDPGNQWLRAIFNEEFGGGRKAAVAQIGESTRSGAQAAASDGLLSSDERLAAGCSTKSYSSSQNNSLATMAGRHDRSGRQLPEFGNQRRLHPVDHVGFDIRAGLPEQMGDDLAIAPRIDHEMNV